MAQLESQEPSQISDRGVHRSVGHFVSAALMFALRGFSIHFGALHAIAFSEIRLDLLVRLKGGARHAERREYLLRHVLDIRLASGAAEGSAQNCVADVRIGKSRAWFEIVFRERQRRN